MIYSRTSRIFFRGRALFISSRVEILPEDNSGSAENPVAKPLLGYPTYVRDSSSMLRDPRLVIVSKPEVIQLVTETESQIC